MRDEPKWDVREASDGFAVTRDGEDFMGWFRSRAEAEAAIAAVTGGLDGWLGELRKLAENKRLRLLRTDA